VEFPKGYTEGGGKCLLIRAKENYGRIGTKEEKPPGGDGRKRFPMLNLWGEGGYRKGGKKKLLGGKWPKGIFFRSNKLKLRNKISKKKKKVRKYGLKRNLSRTGTGPATNEKKAKVRAAFSELTRVGKKKTQTAPKSTGQKLVRGNIGKKTKQLREIG